jgi:hypothetical protein
MASFYLRYIFFVFLFLVGNVELSFAKVRLEVVVDYEGKIENCTTAYKSELDSGITAQMRNGSISILMCLQNIVEEDIFAHFSTERVNKEQADINLQIEKILSDYRLAEEECSPTCGTIMPLLLLAEKIDFYESYIRSHYLNKPITDFWKYSSDFNLEEAF